MSDAPAYVCFVLFVGQRTGDGTCGAKLIGGVVAVFNRFLHLLDMVGFVFVLHLHQGHFACEVVEYDQVFIEDVEHVRRIVLAVFAVFDGDVLEIADGVERGISVKSAVSCVFSFYLEAREELADGVFGSERFGEIQFFPRSVGVDHYGFPVAHRHACYRVESDERPVVFRSVVVGAFHQGTLRKQVAQFQLSGYRRMQVAENQFVFCMVVKCFHVFMYVISDV